MASIGLWHIFSVAPFELFMGVFDQDDASIDHGPDGQGNTAKRHDVHREVGCHHRYKRQEHSNRQRQDRHPTGTGVPKKQRNDQSDDQELFG